jgi:hypothetical protein
VFISMICSAASALTYERINADNCRKSSEEAESYHEYLDLLEKARQIEDKR